MRYLNHLLNLEEEAAQSPDLLHGEPVETLLPPIQGSWREAFARYDVKRSLFERMGIATEQDAVDNVIARLMFGS